MVRAAAARMGKSKATLVIDLAYPGEEETVPFTRADLVFTGVDHSAGSYEVRVYLNNSTADVRTPRQAEEGYGGRFTVFGHGGCYGDAGHCDVPAVSPDETDLRPQHPLAPLNTYVTITDALQRILAAGGTLETVTLVPLSITPRRRDRAPAVDLLRFDDVELHTYLSDTDADAARI